jgi:hypothetical protein
VRPEQSLDGHMLRRVRKWLHVGAEESEGRITYERAEIGRRARAAAEAVGLTWVACPDDK